MTLPNEARLRAILDGTRAGTWEWNTKTGEVIFNERWAAMLGFTLEELEPLSIKTWERLCHPDDLRRSYELVGLHLANKIPFYECVCRVRRKNGGWCWIRDRGMLVTEADGTADWLMGTHIDVTLEEESQLRLTNLAASVPGILFSFVMESPDHAYFSYVSPRSYDFYGVESHAIEADPWALFNAIHTEDLPEVQASIQSSYESVGEWSSQYRMVVDGRECWFRAVAQPTRDSQGTVIWHGMATNIDEQKDLENALAHLSVTDELTELFNRRYITQALHDHIDLYHRYQTPFSVISFDIDYFKEVNDSHGHLMGDAVLTQIGGLMNLRLRATDIIGRVGGEEFLVLLPNTRTDEAVEVAENLRRIVGGTGFKSEDDVAFGVTISGGVLELSKDITSPRDLLVRSDRLLYEAKRRGRNRIVTE